jgi:hypothetical protein
VVSVQWVSFLRLESPGLASRRPNQGGGLVRGTPSSYVNHSALSGDNTPSQASISPTGWSTAVSPSPAKLCHRRLQYTAAPRRSRIRTIRLPTRITYHIYESFLAWIDVAETWRCQGLAVRRSTYETIVFSPGINVRYRRNLSRATL